MTFDAGARIVRLLRAGPGFLLALGEGGQVYTWKDVPTRVATTGGYPGLTVTAAHAYASSSLDEKIQRFSLLPPMDLEPSYAVMPPPDAGGDRGVAPLATDCTSLWTAWKAAPGIVDIRSHSLADAGTAKTLATLTGDVFDLAVDAENVYAAMPNGGGLFASPKSGIGEMQRIHAGNVHRIAVDDDGVYFGDHATSGGGKIVMVLKK